MITLSRVEQARDYLILKIRQAGYEAVYTLCEDEEALWIEYTYRFANRVHFTVSIHYTHDQLLELSEEKRLDIQAAVFIGHVEKVIRLREGFYLMEETKPFSTDLAAWGIGYISQRIREIAGIETMIVSFSDEHQQFFEYSLNAIITIGYSRYGIVQRFSAADLVQGYYEEWLDYAAQMYIEVYQEALERLRNE